MLDMNRYCFTKWTMTLERALIRTDRWKDGGVGTVVVGYSLYRGTRTGGRTVVKDCNALEQVHRFEHGHLECPNYEPGLSTRL